MKHISLSGPRTMMGILCGMALAAGIFASSARADEWSKKTILTVNQPIQVTDTVLQPGEYVLRLLDSQSERHVVQIFNRNQTHIINTIIAIPTQRMVPTGHTQFTFWETPPGTQRALRDWYYPGDTIGSEFAYPKHLQQVAMVTSTQTTVAAVTGEPAEQSPVAATETEAQNQQPAEQSTEQNTEIAQNAAPPEPAPVQTPVETTSTEPSQPARLPKTGSPYPAIGLAGALLLGLGGLLRARQRA